MAMNQNKAVVSDNSAHLGRRDTNKDTFILGNFQGHQGVTVMAASAGSNFVIATGGVATLIDGQTPVAGKLYLLKDQTTATENGVYVAATGAWTRYEPFDIRATNNDTGLIFVANGAANQHTYWQQTTISPVIGTNALAFTNPWAVSNVETENLLSDKVAKVTVTSGQVVALDPTTANNVVLNDATTDTSTTYVVYGIVETGATAGGNCKVATTGEVVLSSNVFAVGDVNKCVWASQTTPGAYTLTAPTSVNKFRSLVGFVAAPNKIQISPVIAELVEAAS